MRTYLVPLKKYTSPSWPGTGRAASMVLKPALARVFHSWATLAVDDLLVG
jgi:hypothetical protein